MSPLGRPVDHPRYLAYTDQPLPVERVDILFPNPFINKGQPLSPTQVASYFQAASRGRYRHHTKILFSRNVKMDTLHRTSETYAHPAGTGSTVARYLFAGCEPWDAEIRYDAHRNVILKVNGVIMAVFHRDAYLCVPRAR